jgi:hypothetical protein
MLVIKNIAHPAIMTMAEALSISLGEYISL